MNRPRQIIWKPSIAPPVLKKNSCLSEDAQRVLDAIQREQSITSPCDQSLGDVSSYYRHIYEKKFSTVSSTNHSPFKIKAENEYSMCEGQDFYAGNRTDKVDRGLLNQHGENEPIYFSGSGSGFQSQFFQNGGNGFLKRSYQISFKSEAENSPDTNRYTECRFTLPLDCQKQSSVTLRGKPWKDDLCQSQNISNKGNFVALEAGKLNINYMGNIDSNGGPNKQTRTSVSSLPPTIQQHTCEQPKNSYLKNSSVPNQLSSSVPSMEEPEQNVQCHSQLLFSQDEIFSDMDLDFPEVQKSAEDFETKHSIENISAEVERTPCATASKRNSTVSSNIARRLYEHKKKRQENGGPGTKCNKEAKQTKKILTQYFVPYKRKKDDEQIDCGSKAKSSSSYCNITEMPVSERKWKFDKILKSQEITITLLYSDGSTQLRECTDNSSSKKKSGTLKVKSISQVSGLYMKSRGDQDRDLLYIPLQTSDALTQKEINNFLKEFLKSRSRQVCCYAKDFLIVVLKYLGKIEKCPMNDLLASTVWDPVVAEWLLNPDKPTSNFQEMLIENGMQQKKQSIDHLGENSLSEDLDMLLELMQKQFQRLRSKNLEQLFLGVETKLTPILAVMDTRKIKVHTETMLKFSEILKIKMSSLEQEAHEIVGHTFAISSPAQIRQVLFEELKLHTKLLRDTKLAKTAVGHQWSTSESVLTQLAGVHPLPSVILEYRQVGQKFVSLRMLVIHLAIWSQQNSRNELIQKLKSTYIDGMMNAVVDGYLSSHWDQTSAATGRLSSHTPNIQAIPKSSSLISISDTAKHCIIGKETEEQNVEIFARDSFVSHDGWSFLSADFQQVELRLLAHLSNDSTLLRLFNENNDKDIFIELTAQWLGKLSADVTSAEREQTKRIVYSVMYGAGKEKLAEYLKITPTDAKSIIDSFLVSFPIINHFSKKCIEFCRQKGYTESIFKRRRVIPYINHPYAALRAQAERKAVNFCVQGSAADLCKAAMLQVEHTLLQHSDLKVRLLVQIHDELIFEIPDEHILSAGALIKSVMEDSGKLCGDFVQLRIPIKVSLCAGKTWGHMSPLQRWEDNPH